MSKKLHVYTFGYLVTPSSPTRTHAGKSCFLFIPLQQILTKHTITGKKKKGKKTSVYKTELYRASLQFPVETVRLRSMQVLLKRSSCTKWRTLVRHLTIRNLKAVSNLSTKSILELEFIAFQNSLPVRIRM